MRILRSVLLFSLPFFLIGNELSATEWVPLDRDRPPADVANITDSPDDPPICIAPGTDMVRVGWLNEDGVCTTAGADKNAQEHNTGISILSVDSRWQWVSYEGEIPEDAVLNTRDGNPVCRGKGSGKLPFRVGWLDENGRCATAGTGKKIRGTRKNISILVAADMTYEGDAEARAEEERRRAVERAEEERIRVETERRDAIRADEVRRARDADRAEEERRRAIDERQRAEDRVEQERRDAIDAVDRRRAEERAEDERRSAEEERAAKRPVDDRSRDTDTRREVDDRRADPPPRREAPADDRRADPPPRREPPADDRREDPPPRREAPADDRSEDPPPRR